MRDAEQPMRRKIETFCWLLVGSLYGKFRASHWLLRQKREGRSELVHVPVFIPHVLIGRRVMDVHPR